MKKYVYTAVVVGLAIGWGVFFTKLKDNPVPTAVQTQGLEKPAAGMATEAIEKARNFTKQSGKRVSKIGQLVKKSIDQDAEAVTKVDSEISNLASKIDLIQKSIANLQDEKTGLHNRLAKLNKIMTVIDTNFEAKIPESKETASVPKPAPVKKKLPRTVAEKIAARLNKEMKANVARVVDEEDSMLVAVNGEKFLIIDDKPVRVSADISKKFVPLFKRIRSEHGIDKVFLRVKDGTSISRILVLSKYLTSQFGWEPKIIPVPKTKKTAHSIEIGIFSGKKLSRARAKRRAHAVAKRLPRKKSKNTAKSVSRKPEAKKKSDSKVIKQARAAVKSTAG